MPSNVPSWNSVPAAGTFFSPAYHLRHQITSDSNTVTTDTDVTKANFTSGSSWWISARLEVHSVSQAGDGPFLPTDDARLSATGDFTHTGSVLITPDPSTPDFAFVAASGTDYTATALPEPSTALGAAAAVAGTLSTRRRQYRPSTPRGNRSPAPSPRPRRSFTKATGIFSRAVILAGFCLTRLGDIC